MLTGVRGDPTSQGTKYSGANQPGAVTAALDSLKKNHRRKGEQWVNTPEARQMGRIEKIGATRSCRDCGELLRSEQEVKDGQCWECWFTDDVDEEDCDDDD